ncbi:uncharacterized protein EV422DRAFT_192377 [Fimicolochytrium jonesii]|uniref:uncharacterized protein n=1 Tax=Fimicolochytrium jonesii TaxID=1396493 RepID=UPI0022FF167F|nr:uncharacterized protein EV422DRAFT_192377 [Fimicolochytrium jonesii]KAI8818157.1 hypothetical protein EV422DRAFT_192377 [Fimicolochytrium jonesii]
MTLSNAQYHSRPANSLCSACVSTDLECTATCCTEITFGNHCVCPVDIIGPTCTLWNTFHCTPTLLSPKLTKASCDGQPSTTISVAQADGSTAATIVPCPQVFNVSNVVDFRFTLACEQDSPLNVKLNRTSTTTYTDGEFMYTIGNGDKFAYTQALSSNFLFRLKFANLFRLSPNAAQSYYAPITPIPDAFVGNTTLSIRVNLSLVLDGRDGQEGLGGRATTASSPEASATSSASASAGQFAAGGRLYFEGALYNPGYASVPGISGNKSILGFIDFTSPKPRSSNFYAPTKESPALSIAQIVGICMCGVVLVAAVAQCCIKDKRRRQKAA